jgi:hypothetical protein
MRLFHTAATIALAATTATPLLAEDRAVAAAVEAD